MEPHLLRTFVAVAESGSFSVAARRLGYTQSAVSQHVAALEADLGTALLTRRPVALTDAGERLHRHAALILVRLAAARADVTRTVAPPGRLVVALTPLAWSPALAAALAEVRGARLRAELHVADRDRVVAGVATADFDLGLVDGYAAPSDPLRLPDVSAPPGVPAVAGIAESPAVIALPVDHPLARRSALHLADLADAQWIDAPGVVALAELRAAAGLDGLREGLRYAGADLSVLTGLVAAGHGLTVLPETVVASHAGLAAVPIRSPRLVHRTELLRITTTGPAVRLAALLSA